MESPIKNLWKLFYYGKKWKHFLVCQNIRISSPRNGANGRITNIQFTWFKTCSVIFHSLTSKPTQWMGNQLFTGHTFVLSTFSIHETARWHQKNNRNGGIVPCYSFTHKIQIYTGYSFWDRLRNFLHKITLCNCLSVHKLNKLGKFW